MRSFAMVITFIATSVFNTVYAGDHQLMVHDAWVREAPPNVKTMAGYFSVMNHTAHKKVLTGASSPQFEKVELHRTEIADGVAKMTAQDSVAVPMGQTVKFEPGGLHLMLINPKQALKAGDKVELILKFSKGNEVTVNAQVRKGASQSEHHHEHMHH